MLHRLALCLSIYAAAVLDTSVSMIPGSVSIHWLSLAAIAVVWTLAAGEAALWGGLIGLLADAVSGGRMGLEIVTCSTAIGLLALLRERWECRSLLSLALLAFATAMVLPGAVLLAGFAAWPVDLHVRVATAAGSAAATGLLAVLMAGCGRALRGASAAFLSAASG